MMKNIMQFIQANWIWLYVVLFVLIFLGFQWKRGKKQLVKDFIYWLVCMAEQQFGSKTGDVKLSMVWVNIYNGLPWYVRAFFPRKELEKWIEEAVKLLKKRLQDPKFNLLTHNQEIEEMIKDKVSFKPLK